MFKKGKVIISVLLIVGVIFSLNSAWALKLGEVNVVAEATGKSVDPFIGVYVESKIDTVKEKRTVLLFDAWKNLNSKGTIIPSETIFQIAPSLVEATRVNCQDDQDTVEFQDNLHTQIEVIVPAEFLGDIVVERELVVSSIVSYIVDDLSPFSAKMDDVALYSTVVSILGLDMPVSLGISYDNKTLEDGMALITAFKELKITEVNFRLNEEGDSYSIIVIGEGESDVILDIADFVGVNHIKAKAILTTKHGDYQLEGKDNKFILTDPDCFDYGNGDLESEPVSISGGRELEFSSLRYVEEYRSLVDSMENYGECPKISAPAFRLIGTVPEAELEVRLTGGEYEQELREIGAVIDYVDQDEFVYRITVSPNKILDLIGLDFVSYVDVHSGE